MKYITVSFTIFLFVSCNSHFADNQPGMADGKTATEEKTASEEAPPFPVYMTFDEFEHHIRQANDTTYVINFWATWCKPCVAELPLFEQLIPAYQNKPIKVLLVSMDFPKKIKNKLIPFVKERNLENSVVALADMDYNSWIDKVSTDWDGAIPFTLIYNKKNKQLKFGELDSYNELEELLDGVMGD